MLSEEFTSVPGGLKSDRSKAKATSESADQGHYDLDILVRFTQSDLLLSPTLAACPDAQCRFDSRSENATGADAVFLTAARCDPDQVLLALAADRTVTDPMVVATFDTESLFRVHPTTEAYRLLPLFAAVGAVVRDVYSSDGGWVVSAYLPDRTSLSTLADRVSDADATMQVKRLAALDQLDVAEPSLLTPGQRDLLVTARKHGYFETPRGISQRELAETVGVSPSAISQQIRTALNALTADLSG